MGANLFKINCHQPARNFPIIGFKRLTQYIKRYLTKVGLEDEHGMFVCKALFPQKCGWQMWKTGLIFTGIILKVKTRSPATSPYVRQSTADGRPIIKNAKVICILPT